MLKPSTAATIFIIIALPQSNESGHAALVTHESGKKPTNDQESCVHFLSTPLARRCLKSPTFLAARWTEMEMTR